MGNFFGCYKEIQNTSPLKSPSMGKEPIKRHYSYDTIGTEMSSQQALQNLQDEREERESGYKLNKRALELSSSKDSTMDLSNQNLHGVNSSVLDNEEEAARHKQEEIQKLRQRAAELIRRNSHHTSQPKQHKLPGIKSKGV
jgi:hypothetical protein